jgi:hypothetical protein
VLSWAKHCAVCGLGGVSTVRGALGGAADCRLSLDRSGMTEQPASKPAQNKAIPVRTMSAIVVQDG